MAKVSNVNIAITGNATGLEKAGEKAVRTMKRVQTQASTTSNAVGTFRGQANQLAESLTKLGVGGRALQGLGAVAGLGQFGLGAMALGPMGATFAGIAAAAVSVNALADSYAQLREDALAAQRAMAQGTQSAEQWAKLGFTKAGGEALARYPIGPQPLGFGRAYSQATALGGGESHGMRYLSQFPTVAGGLIGTAFTGTMPTNQTMAEVIGSEQLQAFNKAATEFAGRATGLDWQWAFWTGEKLSEKINKAFSR